MLLAVLKKFDLPRASDLPKPMLHQLVIAYILISLPIISLFPPWITVLAGATVVLKLAAIRWHFAVSKWITGGLLVGYGAMIVVNSPALGREYTGVAMLFVFAALKLLEAREQRDAFLLMLIYLLLIMGALMAQDSPLVFIYLVACFLYNIYIQLKIAQPDDLGLTLKHNLQAILKILMVSIPFVLVLFFFFPRLNPLWQTPSTPITRTGLSDEMNPESIADLVQDGSLAFRVKFASDIPEKKRLYWRGPVLSDFDGKTWRRSQRDYPLPSVRVRKQSRVHYTIVHDGSTKDWLVPLDMLGEIPPRTYFSDNLEAKASIAITKPTAFKLDSYTDYKTGAIAAGKRRDNTALPAKIFPRARALAQSYRKALQTPKQFADRLWQHFRDNEFYYDLSPPEGNADIDTFLFENKTGYCEHYSSAFVFMLRSQGVPARVVTGYQGGELNPVSKELEVKQLNAHAWAEVYLDGAGWVRYDPTAAVAPERINLGTPFGSAANTDLIATGARWENQSPFYRKLTTSLRAANAFWQNWIINYDSDKQHSLWQKLGLGQYQAVAWIFMVLALAPLTLLLWWWLKKRREARYGDAIYRAIQPFFRHLAKHQLVPEPSQTLADWLKMQAHPLGESQKYAENVVQHYYRLRYSNAENSDSTDVAALNEAIALFIEKHRQYNKT